MRCFAGGRSVITRCRNSAVSSSSRSGERTPFSTMLFAFWRSSVSSAVDSSRPVNTTIGVSRSLASCWISVSSSKPDMSGRRRSSTTQSNVFVRSAAQRFGAAADRGDLSRRRSRSARRCSSARPDRPRPPAARGRAARRNSLMRSSAASSPSVVDRLVHERERAALQAVLALFLDGEDLHRDVPGRRVVLQLVEHRPAEHVRQEHVERDRRRAVLARERRPSAPVFGDDRLEAAVAREVRAAPSRSADRPRRSAAPGRPGSSSSRSSASSSDAHRRQRDRLERGCAVGQRPEVHRAACRYAEPM